MKAVRQKWLAWTLLGVFTIVIVLGTRVVSAHRLEKERHQSCVSILKRMQLACLMYIHDWDERLPPFSNWSERIKCYYGCEIADIGYASQSCPKLSTRFFGAGYAMVALPYPEISRYDCQRTPALFETEKIVPNAYATEVSLPQPPRHRQGNNIAFLDGHVETVDPSVRVWKYQSLTNR